MTAKRIQYTQFEVREKCEMDETRGRKDRAVLSVGALSRDRLGLALGDLGGHPSL